MRNFERQFSPENILHPEEKQTEGKESHACVYEYVDKEGIRYPEFEYNLGEKRFYVMFKNQEHLFDPDLLKGKTVVLAGELPYARDTKMVEENMANLRASAESLYPFHHHGRYTQKYNFKETIGDKTFGEKTPVNAYHLRPETGLPAHRIEALRDAAAESKALFLVDQDVQTIANVARVIKNAFPEAQLGTLALDTSDLGRLEDMMAASAFNQEGKLAPKIAESRLLLMESVLGSETAQKKLEEAQEEQKEKMPSYLFHQALVVRHQLADELKKTDQTAFWYGGLKVRLEKLDQFIEQYQKGEGVEIPDEVVTELDKHVAIHMTSYCPVFDEEHNEWVIPTHSKATGDRVGRLTVHFAIDGVATAAGIGEGDWEEKRFAVLAPLGQLMKKNGPMATFLPADTWWVVDPDKPGIRLPENATIIAQSRIDKKFREAKDKSVMGRELQKELEKARQEQYLRDAERHHSINHRGPDRFIQKWTASLDQSYTIRQLLQDRYKVKVKGIGKEGWNSTGGSEKQEEKSLRENLEKIFPAVGESLHSYTLTSTFENKVIKYLNNVLLVDHQAELKELDQGNLDPIDREKIDMILQASPEQVVERSRQELLDFVNGLTLSIRANEERESLPVVIPKEFARQLVKLGVL